MKTLILYNSTTHGNTRKLAEALADELNAVIQEPGGIEPPALKEAS